MAKIGDNLSKNLYNLTIKVGMAMKIDVKNLLNQPEGNIESYPLEIVDLPIDEAKAQIIGEATLTNLDGFILARITGQATLSEPCSRCLKEVILAISLNFSREFKTARSLDSARDDPPTQGLRRASQNDEEMYPIEDGKIDLTPPLTEEIIANIPIKVLCREDCQGLCPKCGANLNDNPCKCDKVEFEIFNKINL